MDLRSAGVPASFTGHPAVYFTGFH
jgi:hypothetical protein